MVLPLPENMQVFNLITVRLFAALFDAFPRHLGFNPYELAGSGEPEDNTGNPTPADWAAIDFTIRTAQWLQDEGYIRAESIGPGGDLFGVVLTQKGLAVMNGVPAAVVQQREPLAKRIKEAAAERVPALAVEKAGAAIAALVALGTTKVLG
jgi:hypothetical protein